VVPSLAGAVRRGLAEGQAADAQREPRTLTTADHQLRVLFPTRELAGAAYELNLEPEKAAPLVPEINRHAFFSYYQSRVGPGYNPWSY
jgi:hypothetical protein